ncbi:MAG: thiamine pyrophosphate-dependent enzyme [Deltaproteobacteria bacterium]|nr:thiamine pyrophosphate-dependent enzyme [Deltaproteobacteria bacterium]
MGARAKAIAQAGSLEQALSTGGIPTHVTTSLSEALVLGLLKQGVRTYLAIFGHGSTDLGEVLRVYTEAGVVKTHNFRNEVAMAHVATALRWQYGETPAVVTSIGPGALQAMAGSLAAASNGVGVYHIYGDETTHGEGPNMQQIPKHEQHLYGRLTAVMGESYVLHTPEALREALSRGAVKVGHPYKAGPFYLLLPLNTQPQVIPILNLHTLPGPLVSSPATLADDAHVTRAVTLIQSHAKITLKAGGGSSRFAQELRAFAEKTGAAVVLSPGALGVLPDAHPQNMHVGGSKGSISGNYAMREAELVIMVGSRGVCQADCSGIGYPSAKAVINLNGDLNDLNHYAHTVGLFGDIGVSLKKLVAALELAGSGNTAARAAWLKDCIQQKAAWRKFKQDRFDAPALMDDAWKKAVLTQPLAIKTVSDFAKSIGAVKFFDAGDVQANGFQIVEDDRPEDTYTDTGSSYMGFAPSALVASALVKDPRYGICFCGDGSFMMNPQVLIDAVEHKARGMVVIFDNRRMAAITGLQEAQYQHAFRTHDSVEVDYVQLASAIKGVRAFSGGEGKASLLRALEQAHQHPGLSVVHVPVYAGGNPLGGMGAYGDWNVGNWVDRVQSLYHSQNL